MVTICFNLEKIFKYHKQKKLKLLLLGVKLFELWDS